MCTFQSVRVAVKFCVFSYISSKSASFGRMSLCLNLTNSDRDGITVAENYDAAILTRATK